MESEIELVLLPAECSAKLQTDIPLLKELQAILYIEQEGEIVNNIIISQ